MEIVNEKAKNEQIQRSLKNSLLSYKLYDEIKKHFLLYDLWSKNSYVLPYEEEVGRH